MKMIEATIDPAAVNAIRERLHLLGVHRVTAVQAVDLSPPDTQPQHRFHYRGSLVEIPVAILQLRVLVEDARADQTVAALRLTRTRGRPLGEITVSPVEVRSTGGDMRGPDELRTPAEVTSRKLGPELAAGAT